MTQTDFHTPTTRSRKFTLVCVLCRQTAHHNLHYKDYENLFLSINAYWCMESPSSTYYIVTTDTYSHNAISAKSFVTQNSLSNLNSENEYLRKIQLYIRWKDQELKENVVLKQDFESIKNKCLACYQEGKLLEQELSTSKEELNVFEKKFLNSFHVNKNVGDNFQLSLHNNQLKNEIRQSYHDYIPDFSTLEKEVRHLRSLNRELKLKIETYSKILSEYTTKNNRLRAEIKEISMNIKALKKNLQQRNILDFSTDKSTVHNSKIAKNDFFQLPRNQNDSKYKDRNNNLIKTKADSVLCEYCFELLHDKGELSDDPIAVTPCGHRFHYNCIMEIINFDISKLKKSYCLMCNQEISKDVIKFQTNWDNTKKLYSCFHVNLT